MKNMSPVRVRSAFLAQQLLAASGFASGDPGLSSIRESALKGHILSFPASAEMAGRDSLSLEGRIAAEYIAAFLRRAELLPVVDEGTYFQSFPMVEALDRANVRLRAGIPSGAGTFERDYALGPDFTRKPAPTAGLRDPAVAGKQLRQQLIPNVCTRDIQGGKYEDAMA